MVVSTRIFVVVVKQQTYFLIRFVSGADGEYHIHFDFIQQIIFDIDFRYLKLMRSFRKKAIEKWIQLVNILPNHIPCIQRRVSK